MDTPIEESNLAHIGSDEDKAARESAAKLEMKWDGAGEKEGVQVWRVENKRDEHGNPDFGIDDWPIERYGEFYRGDSYIILFTTKEEDELCWDIFFWIGSESSQDEYGVAAYKANELDDLLGDAPVQHREVEGRESEQFLACFKEIKYVDGGVESGFRHVAVNDDFATLPTRLFRVTKKGHSVQSFQVNLSSTSLNQGDAFLLDSGKTIYTWFGSRCSPFEKAKAGTLAHNMAQLRFGKSEVVSDVPDSNEEFWTLLGGKGDIRDEEDPVGTHRVTRMYELDCVDSFIKMKKVDLSRGSLSTNGVFVIDNGDRVFIWIGKGSESGQLQQAMLVVNRNLKAMERQNTVPISCIKEGQKRGTKLFDDVFNSL